MSRIRLISGIGLLLSGCSSTPSVNPAKELCSGTKRPYAINGIQYAPQDHFDYDEKGVASWYGPGFHKRSTSCGSTYDMHAYTAAHKTLPIPSVVEVTNLENGKSMRLVVNDRGPFVDDRIIDLSKKAAEELGSHGKGLAKVRVRAIPEESIALANYLKQFGRYGLDPQGRSWDVIYRDVIVPRGYDLSPIPDPEEVKATEAVYREEAPKQAKPQAKPQAQSAVYTSNDRDEFANLIKETAAKPQAPARATNQHFVEVGSFIQKPNAEKLKDELKALGKPTVTQSNQRGQTFFTVRLGPFSSPAQAKKTLSAVEDMGYIGNLK